MQDVQYCFDIEGFEKVQVVPGRLYYMSAAFERASSSACLEMARGRKSHISDSDGDIVMEMAS